MQLELEKLIGLHISSGKPELFLEHNRNNDIRIFQTFITTKVENSVFLDVEHQMFVHGPYWSNLVKDYNDKKAITWKYIKFLISRIYFYAKHGRKLQLVTHLGAGYPGDSIENKENRLKENIKRLTNLDQDFLLLLETTAGSKKGINFNFEIINELVEEINDERVKICVDSEHMYANGEIAPDDWSNVRLLHMNSIPEKVEFGSHIDRHSDCLLSESKEINMLINDYFLPAIKNNIPIIFERKTVEMQLEDKNFIMRKVL